jgi:hypothetical protein
LTLEDFEGAGAPILDNTANEQGRKLLQSKVAVDEPSRVPCAEVSVGSSTKEGRSWYQMPVYLPLVQDRFALRATLKQAQPSDVNIVLSYWFQAANKAAVTFDKPVKEADGWKCFDIRRDFYKQRAEAAAKEGYDAGDGIIYRLGIDLKPGPENTVKLAKVELYLPEVS